MSQSESSKPDYAALVKAVSHSSPTPPDWLAVGQPIYSPTHGFGQVMGVLGSRLVVDFEKLVSHVSFSNWQNAVESENIVKAEDALVQATVSIALHCGVVKLVNPAYTSQVDHRNGTLLGKRFGDQFLTFDGVVLQADINAATNIKTRGSDLKITQFMKKEQIQRILLERTALFLADNGQSLESAVSMGWLDEKHISAGKPPRRRR